MNLNWAGAGRKELRLNLVDKSWIWTCYSPCTRIIVSIIIQYEQTNSVFNHIILNLKCSFIYYFCNLTNFGFGHFLTKIRSFSIF
jgi:hypothetical protein